MKAKEIIDILSRNPEAEVLMFPKCKYGKGVKIMMPIVSVASKEERTDGPDTRATEFWISDRFLHEKHE